MEENELNVGKKTCYLQKNTFKRFYNDPFMPLYNNKSTEGTDIQTLTERRKHFMR